jgi:hypothetical protein
MLRTGVRDFFRITDPNMPTMGDCGAFAYVREEHPPYSVEEVVDYYQNMGFDYGMSVDHIIFGYDALDRNVDNNWRLRRELTLTLARDFLSDHRKVKARFTPIGVAQGWSPSSYTDSVKRLQEMGYDYIALGGMIGLKSSEILNCLARIDGILKPGIGLHILGVTRIDSIQKFAELGVTSIDSTSPLRQAFKDSKDNYYAPERTFTAIRVPQVDGNPQLMRKVKSGKVNQQVARRLEQTCLEQLKRFDRGEATVEGTVDALVTYEELYGEGPSFGEIYREVLASAPWKECPCDVCRSLGIHVMIFRGAERNRRRGFHNLYVFYNQLQEKKVLRRFLFENVEQGEIN